MSTMLLNRPGILQSTKELCARIADDQHFVKLQADVERFLENDQARLQYQAVHEQGEQLHLKQRAGIELSPAEIDAFENAREELLKNPLACDFMAAQSTLEELQKDIARYVGLTLELGRVPTEDELMASQDGCCGGGGCGCN